MIAINEGERNTWPMNPIALIEATGTVRSAVQGALATDRVVPPERPVPRRLAPSEKGN
jgi:hypothetical protein